MPSSIDALLAELGLQRGDHAVRERGDEPGSEIWRAGLTHPVLCRILESAEALAPFLKLSRDVVFAMLRDLVIEEAERSPFGLVAIEDGAESKREPATLGSMGLQEILAEVARKAAPSFASPLLKPLVGELRDPGSASSRSPFD